MNPLPTVSQIREVKHLLTTELFEVPTIVRLTGVSLRDVFRIAAAPVTVAPKVFPMFESFDPPISTDPDGTIVDGQHRLWAALQS